MSKDTTKLHLTAFKTEEGLIEISSVDDLDMIVGGLCAPEDAVCEIVENENSLVSTHNDRAFL